MAINRFASFEAEVGGQRYKDRILEIPQIRRRTPEFFVGVSLPESSSLVLNNEDGFLDTLNIRRSNPVVLKEHFEDKDGNIETLTVYRGKVDSVDKGKRFVINLISSDDDILLESFPNIIIDTTNFPNAIDTGNPVPWVIGEAKKIPLSLIEAFEDISTSRFRYIVGLSDIDIDNVYRDDLLLQEYAGQFTESVGSTETSITTDLTGYADDFFNDSYVEANGNYKKITDYFSANGTIIIEAGGFGETFSINQDFTIREWRKNLVTVNSVQMTEIEFAISQRDQSGSLFNRNRVSADVQRADTTLRNPASAINDITNYVQDFVVDSASLTTAESDISTIGNLFADGALVQQADIFEVINDLALIGRLLISFSDSGEVVLNVDSDIDPVLFSKFTDADNVLNRSELFKQIPLTRLSKNLSINYRKLYNTNEFRLLTSNHLINSEGRGLRTIENNFIFDKTTADKTAHYLAKRLNFFDDSITLDLGIEAREIRLADILKYESDELSINGNYQVFSENISNDIYSYELGFWSNDLFLYVAGTLPSDPVTDARADFRFTPPDAVSGLSLNFVLQEPNTTVIAELSWTNPTENFKEVLIEYKNDGDGNTKEFGKVSGNRATIPGLIPGNQYDFTLTSFNEFDLNGGVATLLNQVAPGDSTSPATPTGLSNTEVMLGVAKWTWNANSETDIKGYNWELYTASSGGTKVDDGFTEDNNLSIPIKASNLLTTTVTRWLQIQAVDFSKNTSSFSSRVSAVSKSILKADVTNGEISKKGSAFTAGAITLSATQETEIEQVTVTTDNEPVLVDYSFQFFPPDNTGASGGISFKLERNNTVLFTRNTQEIFAKNPSDQYYFVNGNYIDSSPGVGSRNYELIINQTSMTGAEAYNVSLQVAELKR